MALGVGVMEFRAVDLDNAASIADGEVAGQKRTSSGYLPPEMAAHEIYLRSQGPSASRDSASMLEQLKENLQAALAANDFMQVAKLSQELAAKSKAVTSLESVSQPKDVIASPQYDMWCFGALLYYLAQAFKFLTWMLEKRSSRKKICAV